MNEYSAKISVVIPVYNRAHLIERCLDSVYNQGIRPLEIIIVDNNSTDGSKGVAEAWKERHSGDGGVRIRIEEEMRPGAARARQTGLEMCQTEWILFADSDDELALDILEKAMPYTPDCDLIYWKRVYGEKGVSKRPLTTFTQRNLLRRQVFNTLLQTMSYMVRTDFLRKAGGWRSESRVWDDWELGIRLLLNKPRVKGINEVGALIYPQAESITGVDFGSKRGEWEKILDYVYDLGLAREDRMGEWLCGVVDYRRVILAAHYNKEGSAEQGDALLDKVIRESKEPAWRKRLLTIIYWYTRKGGRAAYKIWK